jgi:hypothetical protein
MYNSFLYYYIVFCIKVYTIEIIINRRKLKILQQGQQEQKERIASVGTIWITKYGIAYLVSYSI